MSRFPQSSKRSSFMAFRRRNSSFGMTRELLAPIYGWFTDGFDTRDLEEAKALLEALGA